jgi:hypothetical protein
MARVLPGALLPLPTACTPPRAGHAATLRTSSRALCTWLLAGLLPPPALAGDTFGPWQHLWTIQIGSWNETITFAPTGEVLLAWRDELIVLSPEDGRELRRVESCSPVDTDSLVFTAPDRLILICNREARELTWPELTPRRILSFRSYIDAVSIAAGRFATMDEDPLLMNKGDPSVLTVYDAATGVVVDTVTVFGNVRSVVLSPDGRALLYAHEDHGVYRRDLAEHVSTRLPHPTTHGRALALSEAGLFGSFASGEAGLMDPDTGAVTTPWEAGAWMSAARWVGIHGVLATGASGLGWYEPGHPAVPAPVPDLKGGVAVSADGALVCAGGRDAQLACFGHGPIRPLAVPQPAPPATPLHTPARSSVRAHRAHGGPPSLPRGGCAGPHHERRRRGHPRLHRQPRRQAPRCVRTGCPRLARPRQGPRRPRRWSDLDGHPPGAQDGLQGRRRAGRPASKRGRREAHNHSVGSHPLNTGRTAASPALRPAPRRGTLPLHPG